jgi:2-polyprenyl-3-methyl-5-hydroxy-6-metoxy-1,4-benzoquinol methylase
MEDIYQQIPINEIPWDMKEPPQPLVELVTSGKILPCKTIDLGCGTGNNSIYLAKQGYDVTGIDITSMAIRLAKEKADEIGLTCNFIAANFLMECLS